RAWQDLEHRVGFLEHGGIALGLLDKLACEQLHNFDRRAAADRKHIEIVSFVTEPEENFRFPHTWSPPREKAKPSGCCPDGFRNFLPLLLRETQRGGRLGRRFYNSAHCRTPELLLGRAQDVAIDARRPARFHR